MYAVCTNKTFPHKAHLIERQRLQELYSDKIFSAVTKVFDSKPVWNYMMLFVENEMFHLLSICKVRWEFVGLIAAKHENRCLVIRQHIFSKVQCSWYFCSMAFSYSSYERMMAQSQNKLISLRTRSIICVICTLIFCDIWNQEYWSENLNLDIHSILIENLQKWFFYFDGKTGSIPTEYQQVLTLYWSACTKDRGIW